MKKDIINFFEEIKEGRFRFSDRAYIFLFCLLLSTFFWFLSALSDIYTTDLKSPLNYSGLAEDFILTEEPPNSVRLHVRSSGFELLGEQMSLDRKIIEVDLSSARKTSGNRYFILSKKLKSSIEEQLDQDIELISIKPDSLFLQTQQRISKTVPVKLNAELSFENGFQQRGNIILKPSEIKVSGPLSAIDSLQAISTELLRATDLTDSLRKSIALSKFGNTKGMHYDPELVEVIVPVEKYTEKSLEVPVSVKSDLQVNIKTFPEKVVVKILVPLSKYKRLDASILDAEVVFSEENKKEKKLKVNLSGLPDHAKLIRIEPERVEYIIRK